MTQSDQLIIAYANICAGVGTDFYSMITVRHNWIKKIGYITDMDIQQFHGMGIPLRPQLLKICGKPSEDFERYTYDQFCKGIIALAQPGTVFYNLIEL